MIISESFLDKNIITKSINTYRLDSANEVLIENTRLYEEAVQRYDIFLSHSYLDRKRIISLVELFNKAGYSVYVDWIDDNQMDRSKVGVDTAQTLRKRMESSLCLAYVATSNTTTSKWCPWELGYADGSKDGRCCILPIMENANSYKGQEYLGLYPYIDYVNYNNSTKYDFWVNDPKNAACYVRLREWLRGTEPYIH